MTWAKTYLDITIKRCVAGRTRRASSSFPAAGWSIMVVDHEGLPALCRDHERLPEMSESLITWAAVTLMTRRLTRRTTRPAERRDVSPYYLAQAA
ncbi:hypothetical protein ACFY3M_55715 [Streptomyces mirabilis]|uniref:hypothetical protein n=1 Tax=Streptomyces mirabilis TaxID=68239 RepID=UPI0036878503